MFLLFKDYIYLYI